MRLRRYVPSIYWVSVVLISVAGTLITDNITDHFGVPLQLTTGLFAFALAACFAAWYAWADFSGTPGLRQELFGGLLLFDSMTAYIRVLLPVLPYLFPWAVRSLADHQAGTSSSNCAPVR